MRSAEKEQIYRRAKHHLRSRMGFSEKALAEEPGARIWHNMAEFGIAMAESERRRARRTARGEKR